VQVPGDGQPIVLMRDCQTTGGYPKIATVISADLGRLAQIAPGGALRFAAVTPAEAVAAARAFRAGLDRLAAARPLAETPAAEDLLSLNLVGGVVDARAAED
jgi:allophanate hydrolase subunit 2